MSLKGTVFVLGAGASYSSPAPDCKLPLQKGFFASIANSNLTAHKMILEPLMQAPFSSWLQENDYGLPYEKNSRIAKDFDLNLEDFYSKIEHDPNLTANTKSSIIRILDRVIFEAIAIPVTGLRNDPKKACPYHKNVAELISSGDSIISFNYDCLIDDALLYFCKHWHPVTGYGFKFDDIFGGAHPEKARVFSSSISLLKPHGSVTFRYKTDDTNETNIRFVGLTNGIQPTHMSMSGGWEPFIVTPSSKKESHSQFMNNILISAKNKLQKAKRVIIVGYSFPETDQHIYKLFKKLKGEVIIVNPSYDAEEYRLRIRQFISTNYVGYKNFDDFFKAST